MNKLLLVLIALLVVTAGCAQSSTEGRSDGPVTTSLPKPPTPVEDVVEEIPKPTESTQSIQGPCTPSSATSDDLYPTGDTFSLILPKVWATTDEIFGKGSAEFTGNYHWVSRQELSQEGGYPLAQLEYLREVGLEGGYVQRYHEGLRNFQRVDTWVFVFESSACAWAFMADEIPEGPNYPRSYGNDLSNSSERSDFIDSLGYIEGIWSAQENGEFGAIVQRAVILIQGGYLVEVKAWNHYGVGYNLTDDVMFWNPHNIAWYVAGRLWYQLNPPTK